MRDEARWIVAYFLEHFDLFLTVHLPFEDVVDGLLLLESFEQVLILLGDPHHLSLADVLV